jgi:hypothetical protein
VGGTSKKKKTEKSILAARCCLSTQVTSSTHFDGALVRGRKYVDGFNHRAEFA